MTPWSPDLTPVDSCMWDYLKSLVYQSPSPSTLTELKDAIQQMVSEIHPEMLCSAVTGVVTRFTCFTQCGRNHVEQLQLK